ncbi:MFS transporter, partial [Acinetobacter baumannii]
LAFAAGAMIAMPVTGGLTARHGCRPVAIVAGLAFAAGLLLPGLAPTLAVLVPVMLILGGANGALDIAMNAHATTVESRWGRPIMS